VLVLAIGCTTDIVGPSRKSWWSTYGGGQTVPQLTPIHIPPSWRADGSLTSQRTGGKSESARKLDYCAAAALARCHQCRSGAPESLGSAGPASDEETRVPMINGEV
jgi:hypothetical protein